MANHQSNIDIPIIILLLSHIRIPSFFAKKELKLIPFVSYGIRKNGGIFVNRKNPKGIVKAKKKLFKNLKTGFSYFVFPEGTRSNDGKILPFKTGVLRYAFESKATIIPITINNAYKVLPKTEKTQRPDTISCHIHPQVQSKNFKNITDLTENLYNTISNKIIS